MNLVERKNEPLVPASCLACRKEVWHWPGGTDSQGRALTFDLMNEPKHDPFLFVHSCHYVFEHEDVYDPDDYAYDLY